MGSSLIHRPAYRQFCRELRRLREQAGFTQRDLASRLKQSPSYVHKTEVGDRRIDPIEFVSWCRALGLDPSDVLRRLTKT